MREIKFRAWFYDGKDLSTGQMLTLCQAMSEGLVESDGYLLEPTDECTILMQSTGLRDKSGQEIYEGDILCFPEYENERRVGPIRWAVEWDDKRAGWGDWSPRGNAEVIGNIYENPELLK